MVGQRLPTQLGRCIGGSLCKCDQCSGRNPCADCVDNDFDRSCLWSQYEKPSSPSSSNDASSSSLESIASQHDVCEFCNQNISLLPKTFDNGGFLTPLDSHFQICRMNPDNRFLCTQCGQEFVHRFDSRGRRFQDGLQVLEQHLKSCRSTSKDIFACAFCGREFCSMRGSRGQLLQNGQALWEAHIEVCNSNPENRFACAHCGQHFTHIYDPRGRLKTNGRALCDAHAESCTSNPDNIFTCEHCAQTFKHMYGHRGQLVRDGQAFLESHKNNCRFRSNNGTSICRSCGKESLMKAGPRQLSECVACRLEKLTRPHRQLQKPKQNNNCETLLKERSVHEEVFAIQMEARNLTGAELRGFLRAQQLKWHPDKVSKIWDPESAGAVFRCVQEMWQMHCAK